MAVLGIDPRRFPARDLALAGFEQTVDHGLALGMAALDEQRAAVREHRLLTAEGIEFGQVRCRDHRAVEQRPERPDRRVIGEHRSEEHTSELQSLMRISY